MDNIKKNLQELDVDMEVMAKRAKNKQMTRVGVEGEHGNMLID